VRLVDLQVGAERGVRLQLHPRLNVVVAGAAVQERLASLLARAYVLAGTEVTGTVDGGGFLTPFDPTAVVALDLTGDGLPVVGPGDLPPPDPAAQLVARDVVLAAVVDAREHQRHAIEERERIARLHDATAAAVTAGTEERQGCTSRVVDVDAALAALDQRPASLASERTVATDAADAATRRLEELREVRTALAAALGPAEDGAVLRIGDDTGALADLVDRAARLGGLPADQHREIRRWLAALADGSAPVSAAARALMDEVQAVETAWQQAAAVGIEGDPTVAALVAERSELGDNHALFQDLASSGMLGQTAKSQIDAAHVAVLQAPKGQEEAAAAAELEVLARYGFDSYLEYTIATSTRSVGQAVEEKLQELTERIEGLDRRLAEARAAAAARIESLAAEREPAAQKVTAFLGHRPEGSSLDHLARVPEVPHVVQRLTLTLDESIEAAREEVVRYRDMVAELDDEEQQLTVRREELRSQREQLLARIADLDEVLGRAVPEAQTLAERRREAEQAVLAANDAVAAATAEVERIEAEPLDRYRSHDVPAVVEAVVSRLDPWSPNPSPVLLCDTFGPLADEDAISALQALVARADHQQLLYLTANTAIRDWARTLDPEVGRAVVAGHGRWSPRRLGRRVLGRRSDA
jgi:chaperonin cofactor prefoldin